MGKFDNILITSDLDQTLLNDEGIITKENKEAIKYFESEGGLFTFITGRIPQGAKPILEQLTPKFPFGCNNGGAIYDASRKVFLWKLVLPEKAKELVGYIREKSPNTGIELCTFNGSYFCHKNEPTEKHRLIEKFPDIQCHYNEVKEVLSKIVLIDDAEAIPKLMDIISENPISSLFDFVRSTAQYYEILPKGASKGRALLKLKELLKVKKTISIGDNENDISMLKLADIGVAVQNATEKAKESADALTVSNNEHAVAAVIDMLDKNNL